MNEIRKMYLDAFMGLGELTDNITKRNFQLQMDNPSSNEIYYSGMASHKLYEAQKYIAGALSLGAGTPDDEIRELLELETKAPRAGA